MRWVAPSLNDPDRYVLSQLSVLQSSSIAEKVATQYPGQTTDSVSHAITVTHEPRSDLVTVGVTLADPQQAAEIANTYVNTYIADLKAQAAEQQGSVPSPRRRLRALRCSVLGRLTVGHGFVGPTLPSCCRVPWRTLTSW